MSKVKESRENGKEMNVIKTDSDTGAVYVDKVNDQLGETLKKLRLDSGVSQCDMAARLGVTQPRVVHIEKSGDGLMLETVKKYLTALGYDLSVQSVDSVISTVDAQDAIIGCVSGQICCSNISAGACAKVDVDFETKFDKVPTIDLYTEDTAYIVSCTKTGCRIVICNDAEKTKTLKVKWTAMAA